MPKLTDPTIRNATPSPDGKPRKLYDEEGLFLLIQKHTKSWRWRYRLRGTDSTLTLGKYPAVSLKEARTERGRLAGLVAKGINPTEQRRTERQAAIRETSGTFEAVAHEWLAKIHQSAVVPAHYERNVRRIEQHLLPWLGSRPIDQINAPELLQTLRRVADTGHVETAHRVRTLAGQVFRYAIATGRAERDVAADLRDALPAAKDKHHAAVTAPDEVGALLRAIQRDGGTFVVSCALRLAPYLFVRPGELRKMEWSEVDLPSATWTVPGAKMKSGRDHVVPLSSQAVAILAELAPLTGPEGYTFPANRGKGRPMSENTINAALQRLGYSGDQMTAHGFRAIARTLLDEVLNERPDLIEHQLAHAVRDATGRAYNRTSHLPERRKMMQRWADYLDGLREGAEVVPARRF